MIGNWIILGCIVVCVCIVRKRSMGGNEKAVITPFLLYLTMTQSSLEKKR